jgi:hypothetical protein
MSRLLCLLKMEIQYISREIIILKERGKTIKHYFNQNLQGQINKWNVVEH